MVRVSVGTGPYGLVITLQKSRIPYKAHVWDFLNHFPPTTRHRYIFTTFLAGA